MIVGGTAAGLKQQQAGGRCTKGGIEGGRRGRVQEENWTRVSRGASAMTHAGDDYQVTIILDSSLFAFWRIVLGFVDEPRRTHLKTRICGVPSSYLRGPERLN